jgi:hypothetical protein
MDPPQSQLQGRQFGGLSLCKVFIAFAAYGSPGAGLMSASLIGRSGSSAFRLSTTAMINVARGLLLLYGLGTQAGPSWDSKTRWNDLSGGLAVGRSKRTYELTSSIVPRGTPFHRLVELEFPSYC